MRYMITAALALSLMSGVALAQDRDEHRGDNRGGEEHRGGDEHRGGPPPGGRPGGDDHRGGPGDHGGPRPGEGRPGDGRPGPGGPRPGEGRPGFDGRPGGGPGARPGFRGPEPGFRPGGFLRDRGWRGGRFRAPGYRYPQGFGYQRWAFGAYLPSLFFAPDYMIGSYWTYGLPAPPPGYRWIRNGPDALLVRYGDGYVLDAAYGIFY